MFLYCLINLSVTGSFDVHKDMSLHNATGPTFHRGYLWKEGQRLRQRHPVLRSGTLLQVSFAKIREREREKERERERERERDINFFEFCA